MAVAPGYQHTEREYKAGLASPTLPLTSGSNTPGGSFDLVGEQYQEPLQSPGCGHYVEKTRRIKRFENPVDPAQFSAIIGPVSERVGVAPWENFLKISTDQYDIRHGIVGIHVPY